MRSSGLASLSGCGLLELKEFDERFQVQLKAVKPVGTTM
jgi:hypothetical protein